MGKKTTQEPQKVKDDINELYNMDYLRNKTREILQDYVSDPLNEVNEGLTQLTNIQFNSVLLFLRRQLLGDGLLMYDNQRKDYNILLAFNFYNLYIELCSQYDKVVSVLGYGYLTSIEDSTIESWRKLNIDNDINLIDIKKALLDIYNNPSISISNYYSFINIGGMSQKEILNAIKKWISKSLPKNRENALKDRLISSKMPLGQISVGNRDFDWSSENLAKEVKVKALALQDLPILTDYVNKAQALEDGAKDENP